MGDKSPKSTRKKASQKVVKSNKVKGRKKAIEDAKRELFSGK